MRKDFRKVRNSMLVSLTVIFMCVQVVASVHAQQDFTLQPLNEKSPPYIDGLDVQAWKDKDETIDKEAYQFSGDRWIDLYSFYYAKDVSANEYYIYFGIYLRVADHYDNESFALFLSNTSEAPANIWGYDDVKMVRKDGVSYDLWVDKDNDAPAYDIDHLGSGNDIEFAMNNDSEDKTFYELRFPIMVNKTNDVNWSVGNTYSLKLLYAKGDAYGGNNTYYFGNESEELLPHFENWEEMPVLTLKIGFQPGEGIDENGRNWWEDYAAGDFNSFVTMMTFFVIAIIIFVM
ncbi:MAG: hypothetical protein ACTSU9_09805, partial [Promethearchaeota archaeon]